MESARDGAGDQCLIYGSVRPGRLCDRVGTWAAAEIARRDGFALDVIDPANAERSMAVLLARPRRWAPALKEARAARPYAAAA